MQRHFSESDREFEWLYQKPLPELTWDKTKGRDVNDAICQMYYARSFFAMATVFVRCFVVVFTYSKKDDNTSEEEETWKT